MTRSNDGPEGGPLAGVRIIDLTLAMAGPLSTQRLADMGAEVIKIEGPNRLDFARSAVMADVLLGGETTPYLTLNRNKKSIALDLKSNEGRSVLLRLAQTADAPVQNFRPGVAERLGVGYADLSEVRPELVYVSISGYGDEGPMIERQARICWSRRSRGSHGTPERSIVRRILPRST